MNEGEREMRQRFGESERRHVAAFGTTTCPGHREGAPLSEPCHGGYDPRGRDAAGTLLYSCTGCGGLVYIVDMPLHNRWHLQQESR